MGYQSQVTITLSGSKADIQTALNAYKLTETSEQITQAWHILNAEQENEIETYYAEWGDNGIECCSIVYEFEWVKFYEASQQALNRLGSIIDDINESSDLGISLNYKRIGEQDDDYEEISWGCDQYDSEVNYIRELQVGIPKDDNAVKRVFSSATEQSDNGVEMFITKE